MLIHVLTDRASTSYSERVLSAWVPAFDSRVTLQVDNPTVAASDAPKTPKKEGTPSGLEDNSGKKRRKSPGLCLGGTGMD